MRIFPKEKYPALEDFIKQIRAEYPLERSQLIYVASRIDRIIDEHSRPLKQEDLVDGRKYGLLIHSLDATGINSKTGKEYKNHGDLYITCWVWNEEGQTFFCENAWGSIAEKKPAVIRTPLIELP